MDEATRDLVEGLLKVAARDDMPLGIKIAMRRSAAMIQRLAAEVERYESMDQLRRFDSKGRDVTELTGLWDESDSFDFRPLRDKEAKS